MAVLAEINRDKKHRANPYTAKDFAWTDEPAEKRKMSDDEIYAAMRAAFGPERVKQRKKN